MKHKDYDHLHKISRHARILSGISSVLDWDQETYMPQGGADIRAAQLETLAGVIHSEKTGKKFANALQKLIDIPTGRMVAKGLTSPQIAAVKAWRRDFIKDVALPKKFVEQFAKISSQSIINWREAKKTNSFKHFAPFLEKIITLSRKKADLLGFKDHPYDALLDLFEPEATTKEITHLFQSLRKNVSTLLKQIVNAKQIDDGCLHGKFAHNKQLDFGRRLLKDMGYNMHHGRLDLSTHPFSSASHPSDSRVTTRIHATSLISNLSVVLHEGGHALYEMGLPEAEYGTPLGDAISLGMHESQSRFWETYIGQSKPFWQHYLPLLKKEFSGKLDDVSLEHFYRAINKVEPSFIRVEADEVTYPLHVILRFELERALIEGSLSVHEIPEAWNAKMQELLGITPKTYAEGCLQDVHWSMGGFGYFPTYTLGTLYAGQIFKTFVNNYPDWEKRVSHGELGFIKNWLNDVIHKHGRRYLSFELLKNITGKPFSAEAYLSYLKEKYKGIYKLA